MLQSDTFNVNSHFSGLLSSKSLSREKVLCIKEANTGIGTFVIHHFLSG